MKKININDKEKIILKKKKLVYNPKDLETQTIKNIKKIKNNVDIKDLEINKDNNLNTCYGKYNSTFYKIYHYTNDTSYNIYVFIGNLSKDILNILNTKLHKLNHEDNQKLISVLGKNKLNELLKINNTSDGYIKFIPYLILEDDNILTIKNKIYIGLHETIKENYPPKLQNIWINNNIHLDINNIDIIYHQLNTEHISKTKFIEYIQLLHIYLTDKEIQNIPDIIDKEIFQKLLVNKLCLYPNTLDYHYQFNDNNYTILSHPNPFQDLGIDHLFVDNLGNKIDNKLIKSSFKILQDYQPIYKNTIHLVTLPNLINFIKGNQQKFNGDISNIYDGFIKKYYPFINQPNIFENIDYEKYNLNIDEIKELIQKQQHISEYLFNLYPEAIRDIQYENGGLMLSIIHINFPGSGISEVNLDKIFQYYPLSKDIPFMKYKSDKYQETQYKIFNGIHELDEKGKPYISLKKLNSWRKNIVVDKEGNSKITGVPKGLTIKQFLYQDLEEKKFSTINIFKDGKIEIKLYWTEYKNADFEEIKNAVNKCKELINQINQMNISINYNAYYKIKIPDDRFLNKYQNQTNTTMMFFNTIKQIKLKQDLSIQDLSNICKCLYFYVTLIDEKTNLSKNIVHLKYKRISNYEKMNSIDGFIYNKYQELKNIDNKDNLIILSIKQNFNKTKEEASKDYIQWKNKTAVQQLVINGKNTFEIKQNPGIDIKIQKQLTSNYYKIIIEGIKNIPQMIKINHFIRCLFYLFVSQNKINFNQLNCGDTKGNLKIDNINGLDIMEDLIEQDKEEQEENLGLIEVDEEQIKDTGFALSDSEEESSSDKEDEESGEKELEEEIGNLEDSSSSNDKSSFKEDIEEEKKDEQTEKLEQLEKIEKTEKINVFNGDPNHFKYSLKRLYDADPSLFKYDTNKLYQAYSTICGEVDERQPIVISPQDKERIDQQHPNSYHKSIQYGTKGRENNIYICPKYWCIHCNTSLNKEEIYKIQEVFQTKILKHSNDKIIIENNIPTEYIKDNQYLDSEILLYNNDKSISNLKLIQNKDKKELNWKDGNDKLKKYEKIEIPIISFRKKTQEPKCPICGGVFISKDKQNPSNATILVRESNYFKGDKPAYPGFLNSAQHPNGLCMPCCFKNWDTQQSKERRDKCLKDNQSEDKQKIEIEEETKEIDRYIKSYDKFPLETNKLGMLPPLINSFFGNEISTMINKGNSGLLNEGILVFLRKGIRQTNFNSFINAVSYIHNDKWLDRKQTEFIEKEIVGKLTPEIFISLNHGNLILIFADENLITQDKTKFELFKIWCHQNKNFIHKLQFDFIFDINENSDIDTLDLKNQEKINHLYNIYTGFYNFQNYLLTSQNINEMILWELFKHQNYIFKNGRNIIIFDRNIQEDIDEIHLLCPPDNVINFQFGETFSFIMRMGNYYEPICQIKYEEGQIIRKKNFIFTKDPKNKDFDENIYKILMITQKIFDENCYPRPPALYLKYNDTQNIGYEMFNANDTYLRLKQITAFSKELKIKTQVTDYYNKTIGILTTKGIQKNDNQSMFIPVLPSSNIIHPNINIIYGIYNVNFKSIIDTYTDFYQLHETIRENIKKTINCLPSKLITKNDTIIGIQLINSGIVPIFPHYSIKELKENIQNIIELLENNNKTEIQKYTKKYPEFKNIINDDNTYINKIKILQSILVSDMFDVNYYLDYDLKMNISKNDKDNRIQFINKALFEKETYQRIRFEISKFLQINSKLSNSFLNKINQIINKPTNNHIIKRKELKNIITTIIKMISNIIDNQPEETFSHYQYYQQNIRIPCGKYITQNSCQLQPHCNWEMTTTQKKQLDNKTEIYKIKYPEIYQEFNDTIIDDKIITYNIDLIIKQIKKKHINKKDKKELFDNTHFIIEEIHKKIKNEELVIPEDNDKDYTVNKCKVMIPKHNLIYGKNNLERYSHLITEELLRNNIKRNELLKGEIDDIIHDNYLDNDNSIFINEKQIEKGILENLYNKNNFDIIEQNMNNNFKLIDDINLDNPIPKYWQSKLKYNYNILPSENIKTSLIEVSVTILNKLNLNYLKNIVNLPTKLLKTTKYDTKDIQYIIDEFYQKQNKIKKLFDDIYHIDKSVFLDKLESNQVFIYNDILLDIIHHIFHLNIIIINKDIKKVISNTKILYDKSYHYFIILYQNVLKNHNITQYELIHLNSKFFFYTEDFSNEFNQMIDIILNAKIVTINIPTKRIKMKKNDRPVIINMKKKMN